jgi:hypothetical protein
MTETEIAPFRAEPFEQGCSSAQAARLQMPRHQLAFACRHPRVGDEWRDGRERPALLAEQEAVRACGPPFRVQWTGTMTSIEAFILGAMAIWSPSLIVLAVALWRAPTWEDR